MKLRNTWIALGLLAVLFIGFAAAAEEPVTIEFWHRFSERHTATLKEIRLRPETEKHDLDIKLNHAREFLEKGHKVQFTMFFRGRQMLHKEHGYDVLGEIAKSLEDLAKVERPPRMTGRRMTLLVVPK